MFDFFSDAVDILSDAEWYVLWQDDKVKSHKEWFYYKTDAMEFYDRLPYFNKKIERSKWL